MEDYINLFEAVNSCSDDLAAGICVHPIKKLPRLEFEY
jgi:hypothetical protein